MDEPIELGEPDSLKGTFVEEIETLKTRNKKLVELVKDMNDIYGPITPFSDRINKLIKDT